MDRETLAGRAGIAASVATVALVVAPYALLSPEGVWAYYAANVAGPPLVGLFAAVTAISLLAGLKRRSDPATVAGIAVVLGAFMAVLAASWAASAAVPPSAVADAATHDALAYHRFALALAALSALAASGGYAVAVVR